MKKYVPTSGETTIFVYDASGKMVAEYSTTTNNNPQVSYLTSDHLGSPRITTNANGQVLSRRDFLPFGEEVFTAQRTNGLNYTADNVKQKFTGYIRDGETGLDFAQARMYANQLGRFTAVDPIMLSPERMRNPQQINLYVYAANNPFLYIDQTGMEIAKLGEASEKDIESSIKEKNKQLKKDKKNETLKADIKRLRETLRIVKEGNKVVGAWLNALKARSEDDGLTLADFQVSTAPKADFADRYKDNPELVKKTQALVGPDTNAITVGSDIFVLTSSPAYQNSLNVSVTGFGEIDGIGRVTENDVSLFGGSVLLHEKDHKTNDASEFKAYNNQLDFLKRVHHSKKPFKNQEYFESIRLQTQNHINNNLSGGNN